jgi:HTH-type transcriptional regulator/antitoxin HigA
MTRSVEAMSTAVSDLIYERLLARVPPRVIQSEDENEYFIAELRRLEEYDSEWSEAERRFADLLTLLIEDFEERNYSLPKASPLAAVEFLMDQHGLRQKDLTDVFGTPSIVSEVLSGKRELNKEHIRKLSERFGVSPELFF